VRIVEQPRAFDSCCFVLESLSGADILLDEEATSASSSKTIHRIVARKHEHD
jgi:hypothetical protein